MNPAEKLVVPQSPPRRVPEPTSSAKDLARLRWKRKRGLDVEAWEWIVNYKWRKHYIKECKNDPS